MIAGRNIQTVVAELLRQADAKKDFVVPSTVLTMEPDPEGTFTVGWQEGEQVNRFRPTELFHDQMATHLNIPGRFYDRLRADHPDLIAFNVNTLLNRRPNENRMLRTLDGNARAFLSDRYRRLDNDWVARGILPIIDGSGHLIQSLEVTDTRFYMQVVSPRLEGEVRVGDPVQAGFILSNSEVGQGALKLQPLLFRLRCTNGMIVAENSQRHAHLGGKQAAGTLSFDRLSDEAQAASDQALWLGVRDTISYLTSQEGFDGMLNAMREAADSPVTGNPVAVVKQLAKVSDLRENEENDILRNLIQGGDLTRWGLANAVTAAANEHASYDRAVDLEKLGGEVMALTGRDWSTVAAAV